MHFKLWEKQEQVDPRSLYSHFLQGEQKMSLSFSPPSSCCSHSTDKLLSICGKHISLLINLGLLWLNLCILLKFCQTQEPRWFSGPFFPVTYLVSWLRYQLCKRCSSCFCWKALTPYSSPQTGKAWHLCLHFVSVFALAILFTVTL
jgi:hypothetical protein